jgi:maleylpyruvate isomerase
MKLYNYWRSTSSWRVRIALAWKRIPYEYVAVDLAAGRAEAHAEAHRRRNPTGQVPVLELPPAPGEAEPRRLAQSLAILEYLEDVHPDPPLLPRDPWRRARARQLAELVNSGIQPFQNTPVIGYVKDVLRGDERAWIQHFMSRGLAALEQTVAATARPYLAGEAPTFADVCLVPQLYAARRFQVPLDPYPTLLAAETACAALPAFIEAHPDRQPDAPRPAPDRPGP